MASLTDREEKVELNQNEEISEDSEENSENAGQDDDPNLNVNYASFITTPYERVLEIINEAKTFILSVTKEQKELIKGLEWSIKVISSHSLYSCELKDQEYLDKESEINPEFKQFVDFVNSYNAEVIQMNKKINIIGRTSLNSRKLNVPSKIHTIEEEKKEEASKNEIKKEEINTKKEEEKNEEVKKSEENKSKVKDKKKEEVKTKEKSKKKEESKTKEKNSEQKTPLNKEINNKTKDSANINKNIISKMKSAKTKMDYSLKNKSTNSYKGFKEKSNKSFKFRPIKIVNPKIMKYKTNSRSKYQTTENNYVKTPLSPQPKKTRNMEILNTENKIGKNISRNLEALNKQKMNTEDNISQKNIAKEPPKLLSMKIKYPVSRILEKTFNIFELKEVVGQDKVLPIVGKVILDAFGLDNNDIISTEKLEPFLFSISNQYLQTTLYHNSMHGADVAQSLCLYFLNSNAEEVCQSLVLDLLGVIIAALGHDLGHPGFTNPFHINSSSELALTYNDFSCLENLHASKLFKTIRTPETDIFEKLSVQDYKTIRKRMIGHILATDMVNHGKIMTVIKSKLSINKLENKSQFELFSGNENTRFEEQQSLFDFMMHCADLGHNTKLFKITIKWVKLLCEEFWLQGDKERSMNLPISFLCDRENINVPNSQVGFTKGFVIPTFDCLSNVFPTLKFTLDNAKINLKRWQRLANKGRLKGWTPEKSRKVHAKVNYKKKIGLYSAISSINEGKNVNKNYFKRISGSINSLSHELQVKEIKNEEQETENEKNLKDSKNKNKIMRPNIINKSKNHDKKIHISKYQKLKY